MTLKQIAALGRKLVSFLGLFDDCFRRRKAAELLRIYVSGQLSDIHRQTAQAIALSAGRPPRTLQRFLESIQWDEEQLRDRCQHMVVTEHAHPEAIGCVDESGIAKSGHETVGVGRQYNGNRGEIENGVVGVHLVYAAPGFQTLRGFRRSGVSDAPGFQTLRGFRRCGVSDAAGFQTLRGFRRCGVSDAARQHAVPARRLRQ